MNTIDDLRIALRDDATPAGIDVGAVCRRAGRRRRAVVAGAAGAAAAALVVALPVALTRETAPHQVQPAAPVDSANCPNYFPDDLGNSGPGLGQRLLPMAVDGAVACEYFGAYMDRIPLPALAFRHLVASRRLPAATAQSLVSAFERGAIRHPAGCPRDGASSLLLQVTGAGRTVRLRIDPFGCGMVTNGTAARFTGSAATADLPALLANTAPRLSCPQQPGSQPTPGRGTKPADHLVPFVPNRLLVCRYGPMPGQSQDRTWIQEVDGAEAGEVMRRLDRLPDFQYTPCPISADAHFAYEVVLTGQRGQRATLSGSDNGCSLLGSGDRLVTGVNWVELLRP